MRDLLLSRPIQDVDLLLETGALSFAKSLGTRLGVRPRVHERFRTATLDLASATRLDIAEARSETYDHPGALPRVRSGAALAEDLARRDFTVNAIALELSPRWHSRAVDPFGGQEDLDRRLLRLLHPRSPHDDPTRAFRAVRYGNRLGFSIEARSRRWIREALAGGSLERVSGDRVRRELIRIFSEARWGAAAERMRRLGLAAALHPAFSGGVRDASRLARAERLARRFGATWLSALLAWSADLSAEQAGEIATRLSLVGKSGEVLRQWPETLRDLAVLTRSARARVGEWGAAASRDERVAAAAAFPLLERDLLGAARNPLALRIRGRDLLAAGAPPGPRIGLALSKTLAARRAGQIPEEEELSFALKSLSPSP